MNDNKYSAIHTALGYDAKYSSLVSAAEALCKVMRNESSDALSVWPAVEALEAQLRAVQLQEFTALNQEMQPEHKPVTVGDIVDACYDAAWDYVAGNDNVQIAEDRHLREMTDAIAFAVSERCGIPVNETSGESMALCPNRATGEQFDSAATWVSEPSSILGGSSLVSPSLEKPVRTAVDPMADFVRDLR